MLLVIGNYVRCAAGSHVAGAYTAAPATDNIVSSASLNQWRRAMKTIISLLIALSVLTGIAASANALDA
jgi:hypothetical protein